MAFNAFTGLKKGLALTPVKFGISFTTANLMSARPPGPGREAAIHSPGGTRWGRDDVKAPGGCGRVGVPSREEDHSTRRTRSPNASATARPPERPERMAAHAPRDEPRAPRHLRGGPAGVGEWSLASLRRRILARIPSWRRLLRHTENPLRPRNHTAGPSSISLMGGWRGCDRHAPARQVFVAVELNTSATRSNGDVDRADRGGFMKGGLG